MRSERENITEAVEESIRVAKRTKVKLHISHLKIMGEGNWSKMEGILSLIERAKAEDNIDITFDVYPYTSTGSVLYSLLPSWVSEGGKKMMLGRLRNTETRARLIKEMRESSFDFGKVEISISPLNKTLARRRISQIADSQEKTVEEAAVDILLASEGRVITSMEVLSEDNVRRAVCHPLSIIATNGVGYNLSHARTGEVVHPRCFGTFTKVLEKYVKIEKILNWEEAIRKMTSFPAKKFGIKDRGEIREKYWADVVVINPDKVASRATSDNPYQYSRGVEYMLVNGNIIMEEGEYSGERKGEIIRR